MLNYQMFFHGWKTKNMVVMDNGRLNIPALFSYISFLLSFPRRSLRLCVETEEWEVDDWI
jgi:hypothetical protein